LVRAEWPTRLGDAPMVPEVLSQIAPDQRITSLTADGACDTRKCPDAVAERGAEADIPLRRNAKPQKADSVGETDAGWFCSKPGAV
jgi:hypothetical protein